MATYSEKLKALKESMNFTNDYIASITRIHPTNVSKYVNGSRTLFDNDAHELGKLFDVDVEDYLLNDEVDVLPDPSSIYPYKTREQKIGEKNETIKKLQEELVSFNNCDEFFKEDAKKALEDLKLTMKLYTDLINANRKELELKFRFYIDQSIYFNNLFYLEQSIKTNKALKKIEAYITLKDGKKLYEASRAIFSINESTMEMKEFLEYSKFFVNNINNLTDKYESILEENGDLVNKAININNRLVDLYCDKNTSMELKEKCGHFIFEEKVSDFDIDVFLLFDLLVQYKEYFNYINQTFNLTLTENKEYFEKFFRELAYDENKFDLEYNPDTLERLYNYISKSIYDKVNIDEEFNLYKQKTKKWLNDVYESTGIGSKE